jgi:uncharacterized protein YjbI with pentapeptide repeats
VLVGLISGAVVAVGSLISQSVVDDQRSERERVVAERMADEADRRENLRFVRDRSSGEASAKPFTDIDLEGQSLRGLKLNKADFNGATLREAYLDGASLVESTFVNSALNKASFADVDLTRTNIYFSDATDARLSGAKLSGASLSFVTFDNADLRGAELSNADVYQAHLVNADLREAKLSGAKLHDSDLTGVNFSGADLRGADLTGSVLESNTWKSTVTGQIFSKGGEISTEVTLVTCADATTIWPQGFTPPETKPGGCDTDSTRSLLDEARRLARK